MAAPLFILAGEPSGDRLAAKMMAAINGSWGQQHWIGVGGPAMIEEGLVCEGKMEALTVFGFGAALTAYPRLSRLADRLVDRIIETRPSAILTVDVKGFSLRLASRLRRRMAAEGWSAPIIHTVAPTVWAWGAWRAKNVAKAVDGLLCLFPFEPAYFTPHGITTQFIGHPEAFNDIYNHPVRPNPLLTAGKSPANGLHITMLPGSRRSEISHMLVPMLDALMLVGKAMPGLTVSLPTLPHLADQLREGVAAAVAKGNLQDVIAINTGKDALFDALSKSHAVLAASGTVTLQTALYGVPGVACYKASAISAFIGRRLVQMDKVILPNTLLANTLSANTLSANAFSANALSGDAREKDQVYPFLFQEKATPQAMAEALLGSLADPQAESRAADHAQKLRKMLRGEQDNDSANRGFEANIVHAMTRWLGTPSPRFDA